MGSGRRAPDLADDRAGMAHTVQEQPASGLGALGGFVAGEGEGDAVRVHDGPLRRPFVDNDAPGRLKALLHCFDQLVWPHPEVENVCGPDILPALH